MTIVETETFPVIFNMPKQRVWDLLCCGMESGCYGSFEIQGYDPRVTLNSDSDEEFPGYGEYPHIDTPFKGGAVLIKDKYGDKEEVYRLDREALQRGLKVMGEKYPHLMAQFVNTNEDAIVGDAFVQCALLGEIVYG
jgi:hypothetical protein